MAGRRVEPVAEALFGPFRLDLAGEQLTRDGRAVKLQPQPLKVLCLLTSRPGEIVSREEIRAAVWQDDTFVDFEHSINYCIKQIRDALGDDAERPRYVETIPRKGYRFRGSVANDDDAEAGSQPSSSSGRRNVLALFGAGACVLLGAALGAVFLRDATDERVDYRLSLPPPDGWSFGWEFAGGQVPTLSPDGRRIAFVALDAEGNASLWVRELNEANSRRLPGTEGALQPFWSPDGRVLMFFKLDGGGRPYRIEVSGGTPAPVAATPGFSQNRGGTWNEDGVILLGGGFEGLVRIPATGGDPIEVTELDESRGDGSHRFPQFLPDGRRFIFLNVAPSSEHTGVYWGSLDSKQTTLIVRSQSAGVYVDPGYLFYLEDRILFSQPFDTDAMQVAGPPVALAHDVDLTLQRKGTFSVVPTGTLAYATATQGAELVWVDRSGVPVEVLPISGLRNVGFAVSPDERSVAFTRRELDGSLNLWLVDRERGIPVRFTVAEGNEGQPRWSPDGRTIVFRSRRGGTPNLYWRPADGSADAELLLTSEDSLEPYDWSPDGAFLAYGVFSRETEDIWILPLGETLGKPVPFATRPYAEAFARFAPNGRYIAYQSSESGTIEVYVQPFPPNGRKWPISSGGGAGPLWHPSGTELFYLNASGELVTVGVDTSGEELGIGEARVLFDSPWSGGLEDSRFELAGDGEHFLFVRPLQTPVPLTVVLNWRTALER